MLGIAALEEVRDEDEGVAHVLGQAVGTLERLARKPKDIVDGNHRARGIGRAGNVCGGGRGIMSDWASLGR